MGKQEDLRAIADAMLVAAAAGNHALLDTLADLADEIDDDAMPDDDPVTPTPEAQRKMQADHEALVAKLVKERLRKLD